MAIVLGGLFLIMFIYEVNSEQKEAVLHRDVRISQFMVATIVTSIGLMMKIMKLNQTVRRARLLLQKRQLQIVITKWILIVQIAVMIIVHQTIATVIQVVTQTAVHQVVHIVIVHQAVHIRAILLVDSSKKKIQQPIQVL